MKISKIDSYINYGKNYNTYIQNKSQERKEKDDYSKAIPIIIFDQSYDYVSYINNMLYLKKNGILYKADMSNCSAVRVATLINYLKDNE